MTWRRDLPTAINGCGMRVFSDPLLQQRLSGWSFRPDGEVMAKPHRRALCSQVLTFIQGSQVRVIRIVALADGVGRHRRPYCCMKIWRSAAKTNKA